jgi:hypothetical protein
VRSSRPPSPRRSLFSAVAAKAADIVATASSAGSVQHPAGRRQGRRPGRDPEGRGPVHRLRADRRGLRQAAGRHRRQPAEAGEQGPAPSRSCTYHVVPGKVMAADVVNLSSATTAQGSGIAIRVADGGVMIDNANVTRDRHRDLQRRHPRDRHRRLEALLEKPSRGRSPAAPAPPAARRGRAGTWRMRPLHARQHGGEAATSVRPRAASARVARSRMWSGSCGAARRRSGRC